jgi:DNA invertase Pin-like site-specific DNA recombinase
MALQYIDLQTLSSLIFMMMFMMMFSMMAPEERETKVIAYVYPMEEKAKKKKI